MKNPFKSDEPIEEVTTETKKEALHFDETILSSTDNGYLFTKGLDGLVRYRSNESHEAEIKSRDFIEPERQQQQQTFKTF